MFVKYVISTLGSATYSRSWLTAASTQTSNLRVAHVGKRVFIIHENTVINAALMIIKNDQTV
jgi:hypothetical protein